VVDAVSYRSMPCVRQQQQYSNKLQSCSSYIKKSRLSYSMLFGRELDESVFDLLPKKHKVGGGAL
jgi:hypothetical protein